MDNEKRHAVTNFHTYTISIRRERSSHISLRMKLLSKYNLYTTIKYLNFWIGQKKMDCKSIGLNKSMLKFDFTFKNTGSSFTHTGISVHKRNEAAHSASQYPRRLNLLTYPLTFLQTDTAAHLSCKTHEA